jgi:hypothetical protein
MSPLIVLVILAVSIVWILVWDYAGYTFIRRNVSTTNRRMALTAWLLSCAIMILFPLLVPLQINSSGEWETMRFGFPISFINVHPLSNAVREFPIRAMFINEYSLTDPINFNGLGYTIDLFVCFAVVYFVGAVARKVLLKVPTIQRLASQV